MLSPKRLRAWCLYVSRTSPLVIVGVLFSCSAAQGWQGDLFPRQAARPAPSVNRPIATTDIDTLPFNAGPHQPFAVPAGELPSQSVARFGGLETKLSAPVRQGSSDQSPSFAAPAQPLTTDPVTVKSYFVEPARLIKLTDQLHAIYKQAPGVVIAAEKRDSKILVMADGSRHAEIARFMSDQGLQPAAPFSANPFTVGTTVPRSYKLKNSDWRDLESLIARVWRENIQIRVSADGQSSAVLWPLSSTRVGNVRIDRATNTVNFDGPADDLSAWYHAIQALDDCGSKSSEQIQTFESGLEGALAVKSAVSMFQLLSLNEKNRLSQAHNTLNAGLQKNWGGKLVSHIFQTAQETEAQPQEQPNPLNSQQPANGQENQANLGQAGDSLSGEVRVEILPDGTVIVIGLPEDTKQVTEMIQKLLAAAKLTAPNVEIVPLKNVAGATIQPVVQEIYDASYAPRLGPATATNLGKPNAIMVVGSAESVAALKDLLLKLDVPTDPSETFRVFRIKHMSAIDAANRLANLFGVQIQTTQQQQIQQAPTTGANAAPQLRIVPDYRSNSIVVQGSPSQLTEAEKFIEAFDVEENGAFNDVKIIRLRNSIAAELAPVLQDALNGQLNNGGRGLVQGSTQGTQTQTGQQQQSNPLGSQIRSAMIGLRLIDPEGHTVTSSITFDVRVTADNNSNSLIITGPAKSMDLIEMLVKQLDKLPTAESVVKVFTIVNGDANALLTTVQTLFTSTAQQGGGLGGNQASLGQLPLATGNGEVSLVSLRFSVDSRTNSIIAAGSESDLNVIEALLTRLDADQMNNRIHRVFRLQHVVAADVATAITNWLTARETADQGDPTRGTNFQIGQRVASVTAEALSNSLIVSATPDYFALISEIISDIDRRRRVMVQAVLAEVSLSGTDEFGVEIGVQDSILFDRGLAGPGSIIGYPFNQAGIGNNLAAGGLAGREDLAGQGLSNLNVGRTNSTTGYGGLVLSAGNESINILLRALRDRGQSRVLGRPQIMTLENLRGYTQVGQQIPTPTPSTTTTTTTTSYEYLSTGVQLGVVPRVGADGTIYMEVDVINSSLDSGAGITIQTISTATGVQTVVAPIINQTLAQTTVSCRSGQTIVIGGLITSQDVQNRRGIPILSTIPGIGGLFRFDSVTQQRNELLIILRPIVIEDDDQLAVVNQLEMDRMHWCYADVVKMHGDLDQIYPDFSLCEDAATDVIYPDQDPSGRPIIMSAAPASQHPLGESSPNPGSKSILPTPQDLPFARRGLDN